MIRIDNLLIEKVFSPAAGWARHRLGFSQWTLSLECLNGHLAFYLTGVALTLARKGQPDGVWMNLLSAFVWLLIMDGVRRLARRQAGSSLGVQTARMREWHFRAIMLVMLPVSLCYVRDWGSACYTVSLLFLAAHLYFKACDTPPPEPKRKLAYSRAT